LIRTEALTWVLSWTLMLALGLAVALYLVGCESPAGPVAAPTLATPSIAEIEPRTESELAAETRALAARLSAATQDFPTAAAADPFDDPFAGAEPLLRRPTARVAPDPSPASASTTASPSTAPPTQTSHEVAWLNGSAEPALAYDATNGSLGLPTSAASQALAGSAAPRPLSREDLLSQLTEQIARSDDPALVKAVTAAALSLAAPDQALDATLLEPLKPMQREAVERLHTLFTSIHQRADELGQATNGAMTSAGHSGVTSGGAAVASGGGFDRKTIDAALADAFGEMPVSIVHAGLCRSVTGYGVYEPMDSHNFLSGQANRTIVYVEVEDFAAATVNEDQREVRLSQELILYKEDDGLAVWRHEPTQIVDVSRNRRRDFYVVQMITLPARLGEGRYRLKVRITDRHGDSVDETTMKLNVVADVGLLGSADANP